MGKNRLEAFTDGVIAIIITIMVLEIKTPEGADFAALRADLPIFLTYAVSYANVGIFWNNHHHMLHASARVDGQVLWANLFGMFWLSLIPFVIRWMNETGVQPLPTALYGVVLTMASIGYVWLQSALVACNGSASMLSRAIGRDLKSKISLGLYIASVPLAFVSPWISIALFVINALTWFAPDRRIETLRDVEPAASSEAGEG